MKRTSIVLLSILSASPLFADAGQHLVPAGSLISCTISEPRISSKTTAIGDPVLCQLGHSERYGRSVMPYNSYLVGRFEDYKDPGHFVGKGWMELKFDRMVVEPDTVIPINARVVDVPGYRVDNQGRILGKGHAVRDVVLWSIPILWPVDLIMLPMRGPRPTMKEETRLTLKIMDDLAVPETQQPLQDPYGLSHRQPTALDEPPPGPNQEQPAPENYANEAPPPDMQPQPVPNDYPPAPPPPPPVYAYGPAFVPPPPVVFGGPLFIGPQFVGGYAYGPRAYGYGGPRAYGYAGPRAYGYGGPRVYGYGGPRGYAYGAAPRQAAQAYARGGSGYASRGAMMGGGFRGSSRGR